MSTEDTRAEKCYLIPTVGDSLLTNRRRPILTVVEDTCGVHDMLISCCSIYRYRVRGLSCGTGACLLANHACIMKGPPLCCCVNVRSMATAPLCSAHPRRRCGASQSTTGAAQTTCMRH